MPPEKDWRAPPDEAGDDALQYSDIAIGYSTTNGTAVAPDDYASASGTVTIPTGQTQTTFAVSTEVFDALA